MVSETSKRIREIQERCLEMAALATERESAEILQLPLWHESKRGSPNSFLRSALFAAIKEREFIKDATLFSQQGYTVKFTGERLNQEDMTVWLALVDLARLHPLGTECSFTAYGILKHMGLKDGGEQRKVLHSAVVRLNACSIQIGNGRMTYGGSLVDDFLVDEVSRHYRITLNKKLINLFGENDWTALSWEQRKQLRNKPLSLKLHEYYTSHEFPKPVTIEFIYNITGSTNKDKRSFKRQVKTALEELIKIGFLASYKVEGDRVMVERRNPRALPAVRT